MITWGGVITVLISDYYTGGVMTILYVGVVITTLVTDDYLGE